MGINQEVGEAYLLFKIIIHKPEHKVRIREMVIETNFLDSYEEVIEDGKINPGTFSIKTFLFSKKYGFLRLKDADERSLEKITKLALQDL